MSTAVNPIGQTSTATTSTTQVASKADPLANQATFLTLLVSQLKNQDPLSPVDSTQFVSQLTSYSQLEQLIGIHKDTTALNQPAAATTASGTTIPDSGQSGSTGSEKTTTSI